MTGKNKCGFTLVEAVIVAIVITVLIASLLPILREREQQRLTALADAEPWEVFEFRAEPVQDSFPEGDAITVRCEVVNPTNYPLALPKRLREFFLTFEDSDYVVGKKIGMSSLIFRTHIAPDESVRFELKFRVDGIGPVDLRVVFWSGESPFTTIGAVTNARQSLALGILPKNSKRFQSDTIRLFIDATEGTSASTFDEIVAEAVWLE
jgi:hypothetical protein